MFTVKARYVPALASIIVALGLTFARATMANAVDDASTGVTRLLTTSADAWNRNHLDSFMRSYEDAPTTTLVTSTSFVHGYGAIRAHYAAEYRGTHTGRLTFSDLSVRPLGPTYAVAVARWHLALRNGKHPTGIFSLVLHRGIAGWKIVTDHSP
jgi:ketosteroid isomerase-like protein